MVSRTGTFVPLAPANPAALAMTLSRCLVRVTVGLFLLLFVTLLVRQRAGMLTQPVPAGGLVALGVLLIALFAWLHGSHWNQFVHRRISPFGTLEWMLPLLLALLVTLSIGGLPGSSRAALYTMWGLLGTSEFAWSTALWITRHRHRGASPIPPVDNLDIATVNQIAIGDTPVETPDIAASDLTQQMTRSSLPEGGELIQVSTQANFEAGQRTETVHLAFCPPLDQPPIIECHQLDGPPCRIKIAESQIYGARFEVRLLDRIQQAVQVRFQVEATTNPVGP